jgi:hypothetical protein
MDPSGSRGLNLVALDARTHKVIHAKSYDTYGRSNASGDLIKDFKSIKNGSILIVAVKDEGSRQFSKEARSLFETIGSKEVTALGYREGWGFIGVKGQKQFVEKRAGMV